MSEGTKAYVFGGHCPITGKWTCIQATCHSNQAWEDADVRCDLCPACMAKECPVFVSAPYPIL